MRPSHWAWYAYNLLNDLAEEILAQTDVKGFPIVSADGKNILMGFIDRSELRYVLGTLE